MEGAGCFYWPTVLGDAPPDAALLAEEFFGPVAPLATSDSEEAAIAAANDTEYGLVSYAYTRDLGRALRVCENPEVDMVGLNRGMASNASERHGGVKPPDSGREGDPGGIEENLKTKYGAVALRRTNLPPGAQTSTSLGAPSDTLLGPFSYMESNAKKEIMLAYCVGL